MVSIIMCCYKEPMKYLQESINSILNQTIKDVELVLIVDNPSNKSMVEYVKCAASYDKRIRYYVNNKNLGLTASLNRAKALAHGEYIARMDADDISEPDRLECQLEYLKKGEFDLVGCNVIDIDEDDNVINPQGTHYPTQDKSVKAYLKINSAIPHPTWLVKRGIYDRYDYFDFPACEDYEFLTRIAIDGYVLGNLCETKYRYRINRHGISANNKVLQKTSFGYIRERYRKGLKSYLEDFRIYLETHDGKKKMELLTRYYNCSEVLKSNLRNRQMFRFFLKGIQTFICEPEARGVIANVLCEKALQVRYKQNY